VQRTNKKTVNALREEAQVFFFPIGGGGEWGSHNRLGWLLMYLQLTRRYLLAAAMLLAALTECSAVKMIKVLLDPATRLTLMWTRWRWTERRRFCIIMHS
jgi:hypothetical protein